MTQQAFVRRRFHIETPACIIEAELTIFHPSDQGGGEFRCRYQLVASNEQASSAIAGVDELQALVLALKTAIVEVRLLAKRLGGEVRDYELSDLSLP